MKTVNPNIKVKMVNVLKESKAREKCSPNTLKTLQQRKKILYHLFLGK